MKRIRRSSLGRLNDVRSAAELILQHTADRTVEEYVADPWFRSAVERNFEIIGEAINKLQQQDPAIVESIPNVREIVSFRNWLAHGYYDIDHDRVWSYTEEQLPGLLAVVTSLLDTLDQDSSS